MLTSFLCLSTICRPAVAKQGMNDGTGSRANASVFSRHSRAHLAAAADANGDDVESKGQLRSTAHSLIETLQVQLEREK